VKVSEIMTPKPFSCTRETDLAAAAELFWKGNCGFLPVTADGGRVIGALTDRDVCIALGTRSRPAGDSPATSAPSDDLRHALSTMAARKVHRLIVVGPKGELEGVLSIDDILAKAPAVLLSGLKEIVGNQVHHSQPQPARSARKAARRQA